MSSIKGLAFLFLTHVSSILMRMNAAHMILKPCMSEPHCYTHHLFQHKSIRKKLSVLYKCTNHCDKHGNIFFLFIVGF